ncbi:MAG: methyl-accepting chemotaxis protein [Candidatus Omnitrophica bacterium]|nr:methyl-accepting chemotaxis protein [Candidatus Omnitrophota bacterium]
MKSILLGSIKSKLVVMFLVIALVPVVILGAVAYMFSKATLTKQITQDFDAISNGKEQAVVQYLIGAKRALAVYGHAKTIIDGLRNINNKTISSPQAIKELNDYVEERIKINPLVQEFIIMDNRGKVIASTEEKEMGIDKSQDPYFTGALQKDFFIKDVYQSKTTGKIGFVASMAVKDLKTGEFVGVFAERINLQVLNEILANRMGLGETGENYLVNKDGVMITDSRFYKDLSLSQKVDSEPVRFFFTNKKDNAGVYQDYRKSLVLGSVSGEQLNKAFDYLGWVVVSEMDAKEAFAPAAQLGGIILLIMLITVILVIIFALTVSNNIANPIKKLAGVANTISGGDLTSEISIDNKDEIGQLAASFNTMQLNLKEIMSKIRDAANQITSASSEILAASQQQAAGAREQSAAVSETTSASKELSKSAEQVGENIKRVSEVAAHAMIGMAKIKEAIGKTGQIIASLSEKSQKIGKITEVIDDVADQTNLLAVNAAIEAARAGEEGKGFTVVADEIRKLADSTAKSTKDITALIEIIQHEMSNVIMSMETSVTSVDEETKLSQESAERAKEISMGTTQQVAGSKQIADAMSNIDEAMKQIAQSSQQSQVAVKQLTGLAQDLKNVSGKFKIE